MIPFFSILIHGDYAGSGSPRILKNEEFQGNQGRRKKQNNPKSTLLSRLYKKGLYTLWKEKIRRQSNRLYIRQCIYTHTHTHCLYNFQRIYSTWCPSSIYPANTSVDIRSKANQDRNDSAKRAILYNGLIYTTCLSHKVRSHQKVCLRSLSKKKRRLGCVAYNRN